MITTPRVTWWGHATATVHDSGVRVLTDPVFAARLAHLRRRRGRSPGPAAADADLVVISHLHADHLHLPTLRRIGRHTLADRQAPADLRGSPDPHSPTDERGPTDGRDTGGRGPTGRDPVGRRQAVPVLVPSGAMAAVPSLGRIRGLELIEVSACDEVVVGPVRVRAVPALHDGRRWPGGRHRRSRASALGYVLDGACRTYFAGDTDLFPELADAVGPCDVALLPVGGWGPRLGPGHLDPARAAQAAAVLGARVAVPIHFGTFCPIGLGVRPGAWFHGPGRAFHRHAAREAPGTVVHELHPGETADLTPARGA